MAKDEKPSGDPAAELITDLASGPPAKALGTIKAASDVVNNDDERHGRIARRAHQRWEASGRQDGAHEDHWREAEAEIDRDAS